MQSSLRLSFVQCLNVLKHTISTNKLNVTALTVHRLQIIPFRGKSNKSIDYSRVPKLSEDDLDERMVRGSGPGGQATNTTNNCCSLRHKPTGIVVKCHITRSADQNRKLAREILITKLDNMLNGDMSVEGQRKAKQQLKSISREQQRLKRNEMKEKWKRENEQSKIENDVKPKEDV